MPDEDFELLQRLLSSLSLNLGSDEFLHQPAELLVTYVALFVYERSSSGRTPDGRQAREALREDVKRLQEHLDHVRKIG